MSCKHPSENVAEGKCPCEPSCFCRRYGSCRDSTDAASERRTDKMPPLEQAPAQRIAIEFADGEDAASFLEAVAAAVRLRKRLTLVVE